ncbi:MAG: chromate transporter [Kiritimatiellae bacterium]|nr:chromate transporter [Kiritimatiellia bacterium]
MKTLWTLFWEMFKIALTVIGGGYAILAVADEVFSKKMKWTKEGEVIEHLPIFQMIPGIIAGNTAIYVGRKVAGLPGAIVALTGVFLPSVIVFSIVCAGYSLIPFGNTYLDAAFLGLRAALTGIIAAMIVRGWKKSVDGAYAFILMLGALVAIGPLKVNPALVVAAAAILGVAVRFIQSERGAAKTRKFLSSFWLMPLVFLKYGIIAFGGGYVLVPVYIGDFVGKTAPFLQLTEREFADVMALTQMTPGPIAVNCATFFGYRLGLAEMGTVPGAVMGAFIATFCLLIPGAILLYIALGSLEKFKSSRVVQGILSGVKPVTIAMMLNALWAFAMMSVWSGDDKFFGVDPTGLLLVVFAMIAMLKRMMGVVMLIVACAGISAAVRFGLVFLAA